MKPGDPAAVEQLFDSVASRYDQLNDLLSLGLHRQWKRQLQCLLSPAAGETWLDLCCGTGDLALELARRVRPGGSVLGLDAAAAPLELARQRQSRQPWLNVVFQQGDALSTGLPDASADGIVMAYGLRNLADPAAGLKEMARLLKPGRRAGVLDFNRLATAGPAADFQRFYLRRLVVPVASAAGLKEEYAYLEESLKGFPDGTAQERLALEAGFAEASHHTLVAGQMGMLLLQR
ncbi:bifunctional demethylmenaquinone methyltransferase/2-methoxy-6-polyprenyl-1,4-benzoquinol methylase UbiE [Synechococcus sp. A15-24]|uniref:bifunctional demethylmenaquinone methyltransferase/2-methoxy-6-polyprenyl-1,4-benzoquinol methylase UbiE n=1 Tax=Synechococcus sp. A15-24 TaxID=1050635 RepID=UPI0016495BB7|nr:bifunctional demethylmenaquinone methyltransferase/2-methoxy-6-polyprenyl-1,4-benzoquinol methylase UbiE [Synechococcus sp. A15-24]QNJ29480.1 bifunctional 2-octaprenyl-6-methoxy-1/4-benzoquinone methylase and S-adenosylmethionine:2-DMK methyltransferase [Synechococcus sp. A15-24]